MIIKDAMAKKHRPVLTFKLWKEEVVMGLDREHCHILQANFTFRFLKQEKRIHRNINATIQR